MRSSTLTDVAELAQRLRGGNVLVVDCRFELSDPARGARDYAQGHIPGAVYANLDRDLSDLSQYGLGRHPLPESTSFSAVLSRWGWTPQTPLVAYDAANGALAAARLWWMMRLVGLRDVTVLDGGWPAWQAAGLPVDSAPASVRGSHVDVAFDARQIVYADELKRMREHIVLLDARGVPRYRGEVEPIDKVAGHVPGAYNRPFNDNLAPDGRFKPVESLRAEFSALLEDRVPSDVVHMCGSGVTACHNLLAMEHAGLSGSRVFAPSWSGWISDPANPVARGDG
ncbi:MAG TPA: sulfurtransferase [Rudaea sp.]